MNFVPFIDWSPKNIHHTLHTMGNKCKEQEPRKNSAAQIECYYVMQISQQLKSFSNVFVITSKQRKKEETENCESNNGFEQKQNLIDTIKKTWHSIKAK